MSVKAIHLRRGMGVTFKNEVWVVFRVDHVVKGKGASYMQIELKNAKTGQLIKNRFRVDETLEQAIFERKPMEYLYSDGSGHVVMDGETYEQIHLPAELIGENSIYLAPNIRLDVSFVEGGPVSVELPNTVELKVESTPPQVRGATATAQLKDAVCEGGARIRVPPFVESGDAIKVDTRTGEYLGRA
jgi:elongation factor P